MAPEFMETNSQQEKQIAELFELAIGRPSSEQETLVREQAAGNDVLESAVLELLQLHNHPGESEFLLDQPLGVIGTDENVAQISESEGDTIGRYKLLERIGEGGMGVVYLAQQTTDVRRRVALKIVKLGMDTRQVVARFETERQAMAMFDHPGIARILDAGATESGRPYYVMELVKGQHIVEFANKQKLSIKQRLELFAEVCNAFQHAHQKGIIHRDIKPSNILVGMVDGRPMPKVIDFGIAKALHHRLSDKTVVTRYSAIMGTPQYMSPEQAESSGVDVDTRSDIYGLGVLLYELLTGTTPLRKSEIEQLGALALIETVRNQDIETPSSRISRLDGDFPEPPKHIDSLKGSLPAELDWIVMKSLAQNRNDRYQTTAELTDDVLRFLRGDPVEAAPPGRHYKLRSHIRKHARSYTIGALCGLLILVSAATSFTFAILAHYSNVKKSKAIAQLSKTNDELLSAKNQIELQNLNTRYRKALEITAAKFSLKTFGNQASTVFGEVVRTGVEMKFSHGNGEDESDSFADTEKTMNGLPDNWEQPEGFRFLDVFDSLELKEIVRDEAEPLLAISMAAIKVDQQLNQEFIAEMARDLSSAVAENAEQFNASGFPTAAKVMITGPDGKVTLSSDDDWKEALRETTSGTPESIPVGNEDSIQFLRILVGEFRSEFGESDSRVTLALHLLGAALVQDKKFDEAEAVIRESLGIADDESKDTARKLLLKCNARK